MSEETLKQLTVGDVKKAFAELDDSLGMAVNIGDKFIPIMNNGLLVMVDKLAIFRISVPQESNLKLVSDTIIEAEVIND